MNFKNPIAQLTAIFLLILLCTFSCTEDRTKLPISLDRQPYLQMVFADSATILWKTNKIANSYVKFGENKKELVQISGTSVTQKVNVMNEVVLRDLKPSTKYFYEVYSNDTLLASGSDYYFVSAPQRDSINSFSFYAMGDIGEPKNEGGFPEISANQIDKLQRRPDFGIGLGDIVYPDGESEGYDQHFFTPMSPILKNIPFYPALGNHDWHVNPDENFTEEWKLPNNEHYFSFEHANTFFIALDSREGDFFDLDKQKVWLENQLKSAQDKYDWIFVYLHHNGKTCTYKNDYPHVVALYSILAQYKVDFLLNGHAHTFERLKPYDGQGNVLTAHINHSMYSGIDNGFISITTGAGGKLKTSWSPDLQNVENCEDPSIVVKQEHVGHFSLFEVDGKKITFKGINSETGEVFDTFVVDKTVNESAIVLE